MKRSISFIFLLYISSNCLAEIKNCGDVDIIKILTGSRHGAMINVSNKDCVGNNGWVCLDPNAQHMSQSESDRLFSFILAYHMAGKKIEIRIDTSARADSCNGNYNLLQDARTP